MKTARSAPADPSPKPAEIAKDQTSKDSLGKIDFNHQVAPLLNTYCVGCHSGDSPKGALNLKFSDELELKKSPKLDRAELQEMADRVRKGSMPPAKKPHPNADEKDILLTWIERDMLAIDCGGQRDPGHVMLRRLNRAEYNNTIRDLLFVDNFKPAEDFPPDDAGYGFDNNGDTLSLSPLLIEHYLKAAEQALQLVAKNRAAKAKLFAPIADVKETFYNRQERVRQLLVAVIPRIYRRPVTDQQIDRLMGFVRMSLSQDGESGDRAAMLAMRAALVSPSFLFHLEGDGGNDNSELAVPLNDYELASRLSYFLWSSMPDQELFDLAREHTLKANLQQEVARMLADPKAHALTENFAGQWLELRGLKEHAVDTKLYPDFDESLRADMLEETQRFFDAIIHEDRSILEFLDADFTFVNERLAKLYHIDGITGDQFQRVHLIGDQRGGILTQASILTLTSTPTRTSPVKRGKWILDNILNAPPPPPPPDVPALENDGKMLTGTLRQVMEKHRANPSCAVCHDKIDPLGLGFENFDAIGAWRERDGNLAIDSTGSLVDGSTFNGARELRLILKSKDADFRRCISEKLLIYALGRGLDAADKCMLDDICAQVQKNDNRFSSLILAIVNSQPFQFRKGNGSL